MEKSQVKGDKLDLISIVVPIYKVEQYLQECIDSIVNQMFQNLQIVLVDDGSPDNCGVICDAAAEKDSRILVLHYENGGLSTARNLGMEVCKGRYIFFVDSDDFLEKNAISVLYEAAEKENLDIVLYDAISFDETKSQASSDNEINKYIRKKQYPNVCSGAQMFIEMVKNDDYRSPVQYCFYRKDFLDQNKLVFHKGILHEDEEYSFFALLSAERVEHIPDVLYHHRFRADSIMSTKVSQRNTDSLYSIIQTVLRQREPFMQKQNTQEAFKTGVARFIQCYFYYLRISSDREKAELKKQIKELKRTIKKVDYIESREVRNAVKYGLRKPVSIKSIKMKIYPCVKLLLRR